MRLRRHSAAAAANSPSQPSSPSLAKAVAGPSPSLVSSLLKIPYPPHTVWSSLWCPSCGSGGWCARSGHSRSRSARFCGFSWRHHEALIGSSVAWRWTPWASMALARRAVSPVCLGMWPLRCARRPPVVVLLRWRLWLGGYSPVDCGLSPLLVCPDPVM